MYPVTFYLIVLHVIRKVLIELKVIRFKVVFEFVKTWDVKKEDPKQGLAGIDFAWRVN